MTTDVPSAPSSAQTTEPNVDCFDCVPDFAPLREAIDRDDWHAFASTLSTWSPTEVTHALYLMGEHDDEKYQTFARAHAEHPLAKVVIAYRHVTLGWRARTNSAASDVSEAQWLEFRRNIAQAEQHLIEACALDPMNAPAWTARVLTARALSLPESEARRRFARVQAAGGDFWAQMHLHQFLEPKWFGSVEAARAFVDESLADAPEGSLTHVLVPLFHLERWYQLPDADRGYAYLRTAEVQTELDSAAQRSVLHASSSELSPSTAAGHQIFLTLYWLSGEKKKAAAHRVALGSRTTDHNWHLLASNQQEMAAMWRELAQIGRDGE